MVVGQKLGGFQILIDRGPFVRLNVRDVVIERVHGRSVPRSESVICGQRRLYSRLIACAPVFGIWTDQPLCVSLEPIDPPRLIERGINAPSFETTDQMAKRLRVPVKALFEFPERRAAK
jgi:hypothetical protein